MTTPPSVSEVLEKAADLIEPEGAWTTGIFARDKRGTPVTVRAPEAVCWCAYGAMLKVTDYAESARVAADYFSAMFATGIDEFNDGHKQAEVVSALRAAASKAREASHLTMEK